MKKMLLLVLCAVLAALLVAAPLVDVLPISWHDQHRLFQVAIMAICISIFPFLSRPGCNLERPAVSRFYLWGGVSGLVLAVISTLGAVSVSWAVTELCLWIGFFCQIYCAALIFLNVPNALHKMILLSAVIAMALMVQFVASLMAGFIFQAKLDGWALISGFDNERWFGQFQTISLPLLAALLASFKKRDHLLWGGVFLCLWWMISWTLGSRGTWLSMFVVMMCAPFLGGAGRKWLIIQLAASLFGFVIYWVVFWGLAPDFGIGQDEKYHAASRVALSSSSGRLLLWQTCLDGMRANPWFGLGPMSFAAAAMPVAHPHNSILQVGYEWGGVFLMLALIMGGAAFVRVVNQLRLAGFGVGGKEYLIVGYCLSLMAALVHSLVSGVLVMPYSQLWLAIVGAGVWVLFSVPVCRPANKSVWLIIAMAIVAVTWLGYVGARDFSRLVDFEYREGYGSDAPRFWLQGAIQENSTN